MSGSTETATGTPGLPTRTRPKSPELPPRGNLRPTTSGNLDQRDALPHPTGEGPQWFSAAEPYGRSRCTGASTMPTAAR